MSLPDAICHVSRPLDPAVLASLRRESGLLIDSAPVSAPHDEWEDLDADGNPFVWYAFNAKLQWSIDGAALIREGTLADYHPGLALSTHALECLNATPSGRPFLFSNSRGMLFYDAPIFDPKPGRLPRFSCNITLRFGGYGNTYTPAGGGFGSSFGVPAVPDPEVYAWHAVSLYYFTGDGETLGRMVRVFDRAPTIGECFDYFASVGTIPGFWAWPADHSGSGPPAFPPAAEAWAGPFVTPPLFAGAYDHEASAWIGAPLAAVSPSAGMRPRLVWFIEAGEIYGPFLYESAPGAHRPAGLSGAGVAATYDWDAGAWSGDYVSMIPGSDTATTPWEFDLI